jgi:hypothetical protein
MAAPEVRRRYPPLHRPSIATDLHPSSLPSGTTYAQASNSAALKRLLRYANLGQSSYTETSHLLDVCCLINRRSLDGGRIGTVPGLPNRWATLVMYRGGRLDNLLPDVALDGSPSLGARSVAGHRSPLPNASPRAAPSAHEIAAAVRQTGCRGAAAPQAASSAPVAAPARPPGA